MGSTLLVAFSPWFVFAIAARAGGLGMGWGGALAAVAAVAVNAWTFRTHRSLRSFEVAATVLFSTIALVAVLPPVSAASALDRYGRVMGAGALAALAFASLAWRPLTAEFTADRVPAWLAESDAHRRVNQILTLFVGVASALVALSYGAGVVFDHQIGLTVFNWYVPLALAAVCAAACRWIWRATLDAAEEAMGPHGTLADTATLFPPDRLRTVRPHLQLVISWPTDGPSDDLAREAR